MPCRKSLGLILAIVSLALGLLAAPLEVAFVSPAGAPGERDLETAGTALQGAPEESLELDDPAAQEAAVLPGFFVLLKSARVPAVDLSRKTRAERPEAPVPISRPAMAGLREGDEVRTPAFFDRVLG